MLNRALRALIAGALLFAGPGPASAQSPEYPEGHEAERRVGVGGDFMAIAGPHDNLAFFNYTDYDRNGLRIVRIRLFGEWRPLERFSVVGEVRTENAADLTTPGLYARWRPSAAHDVVIQAGRIPPVAGGYSRHAYGRDNVVLGQPLAYQYLTLLRPDALPQTADDVLRMRGRGWQPSFPIGATTVAPGVPLFAVSRWDTGVSGLWRVRVLEFAGAVTRGAPAVPVVRETNEGLMWSGRAAARLPAGVTLGVSGARGQWLTDDVLALVPDGASRPADQTVLGMDFEAGWGRWLVRSEWIRSAFDVPLGIDATSNLRLSAWSAFAETRYRPHPRWQLGLRVERLDFSSIQNTLHQLTPWDARVDRIEGSIGLRVTRRAEIRGAWQHNWRDGGRVRERGLPALAVLYWF